MVHKTFNSIIIGCGKIAGFSSEKDLKTHAGAIQSELRLNLIGCYDIDEKKSSHFAYKYNCKSYTSLQSVLNEKNIDLIVVCTPDDTHYDIVKKILLSISTLRVIFLEKPACQSLEEYKSLKLLSEKNGVSIIVNHTRRFNESFIHLQKLIKLGKFGTPERVNIIYYGGWKHNGIHVIDTLNFLFSDEIKWTKINNVLMSPYPKDPTIEISGSLKKNKTRIEISAIDENLYQIFEFDIWFGNFRLKIEDFGERINLESKHLNSIGENVLKLSNFKVDKSKTEIQTAYEQICDLLDNLNENKLNHVNIKSLEPIMICLNEGQNIILVIYAQ